MESNIDYRLAKGFQQSSALEAISAQLERLEAGFWMCEYFDKVRVLSRRLTEWAMIGTVPINSARVSGVTRYKAPESMMVNASLGVSSPMKAKKCTQKFMICTGGGPGFMEAANWGASEVDGALNIGVSSFLIALLLLVLLF